MATATAVTIETMQAEVNALEKEIAVEKEKLAASERELEALERERGTVDPSKISGVVSKIMVQQEIVERQRKAIAAKEPRVTELWGAIRKAEADERLAVPLREVDSLKAKGEAIIAGVERKITAAIGNDLAEYERIRTALQLHMDTARMGVFPIPAPALAANAAQNSLNEQLLPILQRVQNVFFPRR